MPRILAEYIWVDAEGKHRSKARVLHKRPMKPEDCPEWTFDGSSCGTATVVDSETTIRPIYICNNPFCRDREVWPEGGVLVLCATYTPEGKPAAGNTYELAKAIFDHPDVQAADTWFGVEQEYTMIDPQTGKPLGFPPGQNLPPPQGEYYCGVGADRVFGRPIHFDAFEHLILAGLPVEGDNCEVLPGQWEFQFGICKGIEAGHVTSVARYIIHRVLEKHGVWMTLVPKPMGPDWNGNAGHHHFSTKEMRAADGDRYFRENMVGKLEKNHMKHVRVYGEGIEKGLTGHHETARYDEFVLGIGQRNASIRIPREGGRAEDRRPRGNVDPYVVPAMLMASIYDIPCDFEPILAYTKRGYWDDRRTR